VTVIQKFNGFYKTLDKGVDENIVEIFESLEELQPFLQQWCDNDFLDMARYVTDDTTSGRAFDLKIASGKMLTLVNTLLEDYFGVSEDEAKSLKECARRICEDLAVIHFATDNYSGFFEDIRDNTFSLDTLEMTPYVTEVAALGTSVLIEDVRTVFEILCTFKVYLPEYLLSDEDLATVMETFNNDGMGSYKIGMIDRDAVGRSLNDSAGTLI